MAYGDKPKKREKDDMGNKGRRSGKGPKPMNKAGRESARQERKNLETENPVVNRSNDSGFDYTQSKRDIKKRYKKGKEAGFNNPTKDFAKASKDFAHGTVGRFVGSTKPLGNTKAMSAMMGKTIEAGLSAQLGEKIAKVPTMRNVSASPKATIASRVDPGMLLNETATTGTTFNKPTEMSPMKTTGSFKPSKRDMELKEAHLGEMQTKKAGGVVKPEIVTKKGPKPQKPKSKSVKPKGRLKQKVKNALTRKKRKIKAKF